MLKLDRNDKLLIIAPHPDDEVVGCGGLIKKVKNAGGKVFVLFLTVGDTRDFSKEGLSTKSEREKEIEEAAKLLEFDNYHIAFPGSEYHLQLDKLGQLKLMNMIERESPVSIEKIKPTIVVFPSVSSYNQDHTIAARATHAALRNSSSEKHFVQTVLSFEEAADQWALTQEPYPKFYVSLSKSELENKINALKLYSSQRRQFPSSRSEKTLIALATLRGSESGNEFAEAYHLYREVI